MKDLMKDFCFANIFLRRVWHGRKKGGPVRHFFILARPARNIWSDESDETLMSLKSEIDPVALPLLGPI